MPVKEERVSIVIPAYNRRQMLSECLRSLEDISYDNYEIIVIDDASDDGTSGHIKLNFSGAILIRNETNRGPAYCKNQGILRGSGKFLWFLDSDSLVLNRDCLRDMVDALEQDNNIGCIGGEFFYEDGACMARVDGKKIAIGQGRRHLLTMLRVSSLTTANLFTKKEILSQIGGFDTRYHYISEDRDICLKIRSLGYDIIMDNRTIVLHRFARDFRMSGFYLLCRNEMRCALINCGVVNGFFAEPFRLFGNFIHALGDRLKSGKKWLPGPIHIMPLGNNGPFKARLFFICLRAVEGFVRAYLWNAVFIYKTLFRDKGINHLRQMIMTE